SRNCSRWAACCARNRAQRQAQIRKCGAVCTANVAQSGSPATNRDGIVLCTLPHTNFCDILRSRYQILLRFGLSMPANAVEAVSASSNADFKSLEEKILRTIELLKSAREAKAAAERDASRLRQQLHEREEEIGTMRQEMVGLRREREEVRTRVEKMLDQIEA